MPIEIAELKAGRILGLADYTLDKESGLIRDSNWHVRVADALREAKHLETARIEYGYAEEDPTNWMARNGLALIFAAEGNTLKAIQKAREALACIPKPDDQCQSNIYFNLYNWQMVRGKTSDAIDAAQSAHELDPNNFAKTANYFSALGRAKRWKTLLKLCEKLHYSKATPSDLIELLLGWEEGHDILTRAVTAVKEHQPLAKEIFKTLVQTAKERDDLLGSVWEEYQRGLFFYHHARGDKEHLRIWERLLTEPEHEATHRYAQQLQCKALVDIYYRNALRSKSKQDTEKWVSKLETLAGVPSGKVKPKKDMEDRADAAMFLGRWRHKQDDISKAQLKALFRPRICQGIRILEDDDPLNDSDGYAILAKALLHAGYVDEACETFAAGMLPLATSSKWIKEKKDAGESQIQQAIKAMPIPFECHGKLGCSPDKWLAFYVCRECLDKSFCVTCLTGNSTRVCDKSHQMVQVYLKGRDTAKPIAKFQGSLLEVDKKWLKKLKEKWGITEETKATSSLPTPDIILRNQMNRSSVC
jgi:tetratricopeptide (TPR) repeat protein